VPNGDTNGRPILSSGHGFELVKLSLNLLGIALIGIGSCSIKQLGQDVKENTTRSYDNQRLAERNDERLNAIKRDIERIETAVKLQWKEIREINQGVKRR
jgi:hypothetical protein